MSKNTKYYINSIVAFLLMIFVRYIPPFGKMTEYGMIILGIFLGVLWGWIFCDVVWPSVLGMIVLGFTSYSDAGVAGVITTFFSNTTIQQIIWLLTFSAVITVTGLSEQIANRLVKSKMCKGRPWVLSICIYLATLITSAFGAGIAGILLCWEFIYTISKQVGYTTKDKWPKLMLVAVVTAFGIGGVGMPFNVGVIGSFAYLNAASQGIYSTFDAMGYLIFALLIMFVSTAVLFALFRFVIKPDVSKIKEYVDGGEIKPLDMKQKIAIVSLIVLLVLTVLPSCLPDGGLKSFLATLGTSALVLLIVTVLTFFRKSNGTPVFTFQELASEGVLWGMLFMSGAAIILGGALSDSLTGFTDTLIAVFSPLFMGKDPIVFSVVILLITIILTQVINNAVTMAIMVPVMYSCAVQVGANPVMLTAIICFIGDVGLLLPSGSFVGAMIHSNKEWLNIKDIIVYSMISIISITVTCLFVGIPAGSFIFSL